MKKTEVIETKTTSISIDHEGILRVKIKQGAKVDEEEVRKCFTIIKTLSNGNKLLELMEGGNFFTFDEAAQKYAAKYGKDHFIASAIIIRSIGVRLLYNFFNTFFKQTVPFKMFADEKSALKWLRGFKKTQS